MLEVKLFCTGKGVKNVNKLWACSDTKENHLLLRNNNPVLEPSLNLRMLLGLKNVFKIQSFITTQELIGF